VSTRWPRILGYHSISRLEDDPNMMCTSPERFESQMLYLKRRNLRGVSVRELLRAWSTGSAKGLVGLTFDDGYEDFLHVALPVV
jgi:peptidoglycan/xylan/chitin deacetylase (PgdA/CDA1 family)